MKDFLCIIAFTVVILKNAPRARGQTCNLIQAAGCVRAMEQTIGRVVETTSGVTGTETLQELCLDVIKGNNLTQCYLEATGGCGGQEEGHSPSPIMQDWENVMQDLYTMCDGACPNFLEKTINITQCTSLIRFDDLFDNSYLTFCRSLNASLRCSQEMSSDCPLFSKLFFDLLPRGVDATAGTLCTSGCDDFESALSHLESCKSYVTSLPEDLETACSAYASFRACLQSSSVPMSCPVFGALMDVLYPQHIFGLYEEQCNNTDGDETIDECGPRGVAKVDHCLRLLAQAWPVALDTALVTKRQCTDFRTALRCLDNAGVSRCPGLQGYFAVRTADKHSHKTVLEKGCTADVMATSDVTPRSSGVSAWNLRIAVASFMSFGIPLLISWLWT